jgi:hypothetical protein
MPHRIVRDGIRTIAAAGTCSSVLNDVKERFMKLAAATIGLALAFSVTGAFAQGTAGSPGSAAGGGVGTSSPGVSTNGSAGTTGTGTGSAPTIGGANGGINTQINPSGNTLLPYGQSPAQPAPPAGTSSGR